MKVHTSVGRWPANAIADINEVRRILQEAGYRGADFTLVTNYVALDILSYQIPSTLYTYLGWMKTHELLFDIVLDSNLPLDEVYVFATKKNFPMLCHAGGTDWWNGCLKVLKEDSGVKIKAVNGEW